MTTTWQTPLILDWGIGGLGTVAQLHRDRSFVYFSDAGFTPYGKVSPAQLKSRIKSILAYAKAEYGCDGAVIACNAASATIMNTSLSLPTMDIISLATSLALSNSKGQLGVIGGNGTIASGHYQDQLSALAPICVSAQPLSALVESGDIESPHVTQEVGNVLKQLGPINTLLFACTHYPALLPVFQTCAPHVQYLDPAETLASKLSNPAEKTNTTRTYLTTGDSSQMVSSGYHAFKVKIPRVQKVQLDSWHLS